MTDLDDREPTAQTILDGVDGLLAAVGTHLGCSEWLQVSDARVDQFVRATTPGALSGVEWRPDGAVDVPEHLVLALSNYFLPRVVEVRGFSMGVNYGTEAVRFPAPLTVGAKVRAGVELASVQPVTGGVQTTMVVTIEDDDLSPVCIVHALSRYLS